ncbi:hypothetical protein LXL04_039688 [Taraxacum kok-saghyz]
MSGSPTDTPIIPVSSSPLLPITNISNFVSVKLNEDNYLVWKHQISSVFESLDLIKFVNGTSLQPPEASIEFTAWNKLNKYVEICINATLSPSIAHVAVGTKTAFELWKKLQSLFAQQISAKRIQLQTKLHQIKQGTRKIDEYCSKISNISQSLASIGVNTDESDLIIHALTGLNHDYKVIDVNIENATELPSFMELTSKLLVYKQRLIRESHDNSTVEVFGMVASKTLPHLTQVSNTNRGKEIVNFANN